MRMCVPSKVAMLMAGPMKISIFGGNFIAIIRTTSRNCIISMLTSDEEQGKHYLV